MSSAQAGRGARHLVQLVVAVFAAIALAPLAVVADSEAGNRVVFSVKAERDLPNDHVVAHLRVEQQARDVGKLNNSLNALMADAVDAAAEFDAVEIQTRPANARPVYDADTGKLRQWRASQSLTLSSDDFAQTQQLMQQLQETFAVSRVIYSVQTQTREDTEDELIRDALLRAQQRAELVANQMGMSDVRMIRLEINPANGAFPVQRRDVMMASSAVVETAPSLEAGSSKVVVRINVEVELLP